MDKENTSASTKIPKILIPLVWLIAGIGISIWLYLTYFLVFKFQTNKSLPFDLIYCIVRNITFLIISISGIYLLSRASLTRASFYFALFISIYSQRDGLFWLIKSESLPDFWMHLFNIEFVASIVLLIKCLQEFPTHLSSNKILKVHYINKRFHFLIAPTLWLLKGNRIWFVFFPLGLTIKYFDNNVIIQIYTLLILCLSLFYIRVQHKSCNAAQAKKLYWIIWALLCFIFVAFFNIFVALDLYDLSTSPYLPFIKFIIEMLQHFSLIFAVIMTIFFSDLLDSALILRATILYGFLFFIITLLFGMGEHFIIHNISHYFHFNDSYLLSGFAGFTGMLIHPIKEKMEHYIKRITTRQS